MQSFYEFSIPEQLIKALEIRGITQSTPVQELIIPQLLQNKNIVFQSDTGTGKTLSYLLPSCMRLKLDEKNLHPQILILAPTNELASQIKNEVQLLADHSKQPIKSSLFIGSAPLKRQIENLKAKPHIIIGTPARIIELIRLKKLKTIAISMLILDEADRLLSPEMRDFIQELSTLIPFEAQIVASSATMTQNHLNILKKMFVSKDQGRKDQDKTGFEKRTFSLVQLPSEKIIEQKIEHWAFWCEQRQKIDLLRRFILAEKPTKVLIFTSVLGQVDNICSQLNYKGITAASLHAKLGKKERKTAIDAFRSGKVSILVTSDLAARGLDFLDISHIIQLDVNENEDFFIHRAGRTARAGKTGINVIFGDAREMHALSRIEKKLGIIIHPKELYEGKVQAPKIE